MKKMITLVNLLVLATLVFTACGGQQSPTAVPMEMETSQAPAATSEVVSEPGAWLDMTLTDARSGTSFKLSDFSETVVILEMMDPGCFQCKYQVKEIVAALEAVGDKAIVVSIDVGRKGESAQVKWADENGAVWSLAQMTDEIAQALVADFGSQILASFSTPVIIIDPSGEPHVTDPGIKKSATLVDLVNQWSP